MSGRGYFTVITKSHLAYARVLMAQLQRLEPAAERYVFFADEIARYVDPHAECFTTIEPKDFLTPDELKRLGFQYNAFEFCNAAKGFSHRYLNEKTELDEWMYFDSDIYLTASPDELFKQEPEASVLMTPHSLGPIDASRMAGGNEFITLRHLQRRLVMRSPIRACEALYRLVSPRLLTLCFDDYRDTFVDQLWLNLAPLHLKAVRHIENPGANIGYWNLHERPLSFSLDEKLCCNEQPVYFLHFSGWNPKDPLKLSLHATGTSGSDAWNKIAVEYANAVLAAGFSESREWPYSWARFDTGKPIKISQRRGYYRQVMAGVWPAGQDPFASETLFKRPGVLRRARRIAGRLRRSFSGDK